jgi:hypothetical protein
LYHEQDKTSEFFKYVLVPNWKKWFKASGVSCDPFYLAEYWTVPNQFLPEPKFVQESVEGSFEIVGDMEALDLRENQN